MPPTRMPREVVSFVRRSARMNESQQRAWDAHSTWVVPVEHRGPSTSVAEGAHVDWAAVFGREAPLVVEIGGGTGHAVAAHASAHPELDHVVFEVHQPSVASTLSRLARAGVSNVRIVMANGTEGVDRLFAPGQIAELWTFFPDPWHKKRHHKRRLITADFAHTVATRLASGALWRIATDWADYAEWIRTELDPLPELTNLYPHGAPRWEGRPVTKFESRGVDEGRPIVDLCYRRA